MLEGGDRAFARLYAALRKPVARFALKKTGSREVAEDLCQEIFLKLHRFRHTYVPGLPFLPWFWQLARNATTDLLRRRRQRLEVLESEISENGGFLEEQLSEEPGADLRVLRRDERRLLFKRLRCLTRLQQRVIWLRFVHELPCAEVAARLGLTLASVKCLLQRARAALAADPLMLPATL
jgi:RNA polymerase sigma-70 factor (ECF subfamily)